MKTFTCLVLVSAALAFVLHWSSAVGLRAGALAAADGAIAPPATQPAPVEASQPATRPARKPVSPTSAEVEAHILKLQKAHPELVAVREVFKTYRGRPIYAVTVTDPKPLDDDKQRALIIAGRHGNEETGRMIALSLLDWLVSEQGAATRTKQKIVVMPNINPDGAEQDIYEPPPATGPTYETGEDGRPPESAAWARLAREMQPDLFIDMHARGGAGASYDMVLYPGTRDYTEDENLIRALAAEMVRVGEEAGIPQITHPLGWWTPDNPAARAPNIWTYRQYKSLSLLTENCESNTHRYPDELRVKSGLARILTAIELGNQRHPKFHYEGYPGYLMGMYSGGLVPVGETAAERRAGRVAIWKRFGDVSLRAALPEQAKLKKTTVQNKGAAIECGVGVLFRAQGKLNVQSVTVDGKALEPSETNGYYSWHDVCSTFVVVAMPSLPAGKLDIEVRFE